MAREVTLADPIEDLACELIKEAAGRTAAVAGDGTTTATVLAHEIFKRGNDLINENYSPLYFKRGVEWAVERVVDNLSRMATEVDGLKSLENIATISANNDNSIGELISEAMEKVGNEGVITVEEAKSTETLFRNC